MPKMDMFTNQEVLNKALKMVKWKSDTARRLFEKTTNAYDTRNITPLAAMIIDVNDIPENKREVYFKEEFDKIMKAFNTINPETNRPYSEAVKFYIDKMYKSIPTDLESIDWDDEKQVEKLLCSLPLDQALSTMILDFKQEVFETFTSFDDAAMLDATLAKVHYNFLRADAALRGKIKDVTEFLNVSSSNLERFDTKVEITIGESIANATLDGSNVINIDTSKNELIEDMFLKKQYLKVEVFDERTNDMNHFTEETCARNCLYDISKAYLRTPIEQSLVKIMLDKSDDFEEKSMLFINGKSMKDIVTDIKKNNDLTSFEAEREAAFMLRDALTDGKSVVTKMRVSFNDKGNTSFCHQEIKVDLDRLNKMDFEERYKKANFLRKFLHDYGIWKISNKYASNEARDKVQAAEKEKTEFKNSLSKAEKDFVDIYNSLDRSRDINEKKHIFNIIPKLKYPNEKVDTRETIEIKDIDINNAISSKEPKIDEKNITVKNHKSK